MNTLKTLLAGVIVMAGIGKISAAEIAVNFDASGNNDLKAYIYDRNDSNPGVSEVPAPQFTEVGDMDLTGGLILAKDILNGVSPEFRLRFMLDLNYVEKRVSKEGERTLMEAALHGYRVEMVKRVFDGMAAATPSRTFVANQDLRSLMADLPQSVQADFFDNLKFLHGRVASAKTDMLAQATTTEKFQSILAAIMVPEAGAAGTRAILKDHACWASTGAKGRAVLRGCSNDPGYTCDSSVCN